MTASYYQEGEPADWPRLESGGVHEAAKQEARARSDRRPAGRIVSFLCVPVTARLRSVWSSPHGINECLFDSRAVSLSKPAPAPAPPQQPGHRPQPRAPVSSFMASFPVSLGLASVKNWAAETGYNTPGQALSFSFHCYKSLAFAIFYAYCNFFYAAAGVSQTA